MVSQRVHILKIATSGLSRLRFNYLLCFLARVAISRDSSLLEADYLNPSTFQDRSDHNTYQQRGIRQRIIQPQG